MYELQVDNMSCGHCVKAVTRAVQALDPAASVEVDLASKTVKVGTGAALADVKAAIEEADYPVVAAQ